MRIKFIRALLVSLPRLARMILRGRKTISNTQRESSFQSLTTARKTILDRASP